MLELIILFVIFFLFGLYTKQYFKKEVDNVTNSCVEQFSILQSHQSRIIDVLENQKDVLENQKKEINDLKDSINKTNQPERTRKKTMTAPKKKEKTTE